MNLWAIPLFLLYLTPLLKIVSLVLLFFAHLVRLPSIQIFHVVNDTLGTWEYYVRGPRTFLVLPLAIVMLGFNLARGEPFFIPALILALTAATFHWQMETSLQMAEVLRTHPHIHPEDFFALFKRKMGPFPPSGTGDIRLVSPGEADFRCGGRSRQSLLTIIVAVWDTAHIAHLGLRSLKYVGEKYVREIVDLMGAIWGKRLLELIQGKLSVTGVQNLENLSGKIILILNHKSQLDFALLFFALSGIRLASGRKIRTRFILAKDHFKDNRIVYDLLGVGKLIEAVDMIFLDRKRKKKGQENMKQAAFFLAKKEMEVVIFPQGTRAEGNLDRTDKRRDAGYYTTIRQRDVEDDLGHLRKGTAYLALDALMEMNPGEELHLVFVGVSGTATALPKHSVTLQTECEIQFDIALPLTLSASDAENITKPLSPTPKTESEKRYLSWVNEIHAAIDKKLILCLGIHDSLRTRFLLDLKGYFRFTKDRVEAVEKNMDRIGGEDPVIYQILDRIYACKPSEWNPYLSELAQLLLDQSSLTRLKELRTQVTWKMLKKS
ncbi:MAG: lysophospholipid acyltransferase family protein [Deltaproteobacteria bacterium]|nr:lysophospholipid acyltransferase family protein [Deltaproteobacteria bacterium]